ncbi:hypothetical protein FJD32_004230 [Shewanella sp. LC6]|uniref:hypothetical protein n=1 Tax=unclassified Shewanella TaxID=196818 RepID=UPI00112EB2A2|nr:MULTISPECIES: hypothetical protein [unclassified Shewanella]QQK58788.1 hypothetical protein FJD32_004230 [Shewanella sp. LC6]TPE50647.1 hypothetical protein FJD33_20100 [Shewanella sp. LC2]
MGRDRQDRTTEEWATFGHHLLDMIGKKHKLYKEIARLITKLTVQEDDINKAAVTHTLNNHKYELKDHWRKWTQKIKQTPKDAERTKFYIKKSTFENILNFICLSPEIKLKKGISDEAIFDTLFMHLNSYGIENTKEMYEIIENLKKYKPTTIEQDYNQKLFEQKRPKLSSPKADELQKAISKIRKETKTKSNGTKDEKAKKNIETLINVKRIIYNAPNVEYYQGENNKIINTILEELKKNNINSLEKLRNIKEIINNELKDENEILHLEIKSLRTKVTELEDKFPPH